MSHAPPLRLATAVSAHRGLVAALALGFVACFPEKEVPDSEPLVPVDTQGDTDALFHGEGWILAEAHGLAAKLQESDCTTCHGEDLLGGSAGVSCDSCHGTDWRTDCLWCHGGMDDVTGAPPLDMDGLGTELSFPEHGAHVQETIHAAWGCEQCHLEVEDIFSPGHLFVDDTTPGEAEISLLAGLSADGGYLGGASCDNLYCHGDGAGNLGSAETGLVTDCASCHGDAELPGALTGVHQEHLEQGATCEDCHADTAAGTDDIAEPALHVDGVVDVSLADGMSWDGASCAGSCHEVIHGGSTWGGQYHGTGWGDEAHHGAAAKQQELVCVDCHGEDLAGGSAGVSCDDCHQEGWRTDCVRCHGGTDNEMGAPPLDIDGSNITVSFPEHSQHVELTIHAAWGCDQCHHEPDDALSDGHFLVGDATPGVAELDLGSGLSPAAVYEGRGSCSNLYCHGDGVDVLGDATSGETKDCGDCHGGQASADTLSGTHVEHVDAGVDCEACHVETADGSEAILDPAKHVDGSLDVVMQSSLSWDGVQTCTGRCHSLVHTGSTWGGLFHGATFADPVVHGPVAKLKQMDCARCHGADLRGGSASTSCDDCHTAGWRSDCTRCHGGTDNETGAPPLDIDDSATGLSFAAHGRHVEDTDQHAAWSCEQCHAAYGDVMDAGHLFTGDSTAAQAEVDLGAGLAVDASYDGLGTCADVYCHGDGAGTLGTVTTTSFVACGDCHGVATSAGTLSGTHATHVSAGVECGDCHADTALGNTEIVDIAQHVDGELDLALASGMSYDPSDGSCAGSCHGESHGGWTFEGGHSAGWDAGAVHGLPYKQQSIDCTSCHGVSLGGGTSGVSCDDCHDPGWSTDCSFCHGGVDNSTGAPPEDIDDSSSGISFPDHSAHVETTGLHAAFDCEQCHLRTGGILSSGHIHVGDSTPGVAEVTMASGLSTTGSYGSGSCSNLYCHGDGADGLGSASSGGSVACGDCHGDASSASSLSGTHAAHIAAGADCADCHADTASGSSGIADVSQHVDGELDLALVSGMSWNPSAQTCTGSCHGESHSGWGFESVHSAGWGAGAVHGLAAKQGSDCTSCHGVSLGGGSSGVSCDDCHSSGWTSDCTFCHGGVDNSTGAPPEDIDDSTGSASFPDHSAHVEITSMHAAWGCEQCHPTPSDAWDAGHFFSGDSTPGVAEVDLSGGLSDAGGYLGGSCSNLYCHGDGAGTLGTAITGSHANCGVCHGTDSSASTLSDGHQDHVDAGATCEDCHADTASGSSAIADVNQHVDGELDVSLVSGMSYDASAGTCTGTCHGQAHSGWGMGSAHSTGWDAGSVHGLAYKQQSSDCTACHGSGLTGGSASTGCDDCHSSGWRSDCTFCHGGIDNSTGAPPEDIDDSSAGIGFPGHSAHVETTSWHAAFDCDQCHVLPSSMASSGHAHVGDSTAAQAEVSMSAGLSSAGTFSGSTCSNLYCHGDGAGTLGSETTTGAVICGDCHGKASTASSLSATHGLHVAAGAACSDCHADTASGSVSIADPAQHVDGEIDVAMVSGMVWDGVESCTGTCHGETHSGWSFEGGHPTGWDAGAVHGLAYKQQSSDCTSCHGSGLTGGSASSGCDDCHSTGWRTDCTFCHGGVDNSTGAPPEDMDDSSTGLSFPAHSSHVETTTWHVAFDCDECHAVPSSMSSSGHAHVGDSTAAQAEVTMASGLSSAGILSGSTCSNLYCHGDGAGSLGSATTSGSVACGDCHGDASSASSLSVGHSSHVADGVTCADCHAATASGSTGIAFPAQHVDGEIDVSLVSGISWDPSAETCTGTCHGETHSGWGMASGHGSGWDDPGVHGLEAKEQTSDCTTCHGSSLTGGSASTSCDDCHSTGWRTDCTFCHGGIDNSTGAPPEDIDDGTTGLSFGDHTEHVEQSDHPAFDCDSCHDTPSDVMSSGHVFVGDSTAGVAEVDMSGGLSSAGSFAIGSRTCSNLYCHGNGAGVRGSVTIGDSTNCSSCHGSRSSSSGMSGDHRDHISEGVDCGECHADTLSGSTSISNPSNHVNGSVDVRITGLSYSGSRCTGSCHGEYHSGERW